MSKYDPEIVTSDIELERGGDLIPFTINGYIIYYEDKCFGEDADGYRGIRTITVEDVAQIGVYTEDLDDVFDSLTEAEVEQVKAKLTEEFLNQ